MTKSLFANQSLAKCEVRWEKRFSLEEFKKNDSRQLGYVYECYYDYLTAFAKSRDHRPDSEAAENAKDQVSAVFLKFLVIDKQTFLHPKQIKACLHKMVINQSIDVQRREVIIRKHDKKYHKDCKQKAEVEVSDLPYGLTDVETTALKRIADKFTQLTPFRKKVMTSKCQGMKTEDIVKDFGCSNQNILNTYSNIKNDLKRAIKDLNVITPISNGDIAQHANILEFFQNQMKQSETNTPVQKKPTLDLVTS